MDYVFFFNINRTTNWNSICSMGRNVSLWHLGDHK